MSLLFAGRSAAASPTPGVTSGPVATPRVASDSSSFRPRVTRSPRVSLASSPLPLPTPHGGSLSAQSLGPVPVVSRGPGGEWRAGRGGADREGRFRGPRAEGGGVKVRGSRRNGRAAGRGLGASRRAGGRAGAVLAVPAPARPGARLARDGVAAIHASRPSGTAPRPEAEGGPRLGAEETDAGVKRGGLCHPHLRRANRPARPRHSASFGMKTRLPNTGRLSLADWSSTDVSLQSALLTRPCGVLSQALTAPFRAPTPRRLGSGDGRVGGG